VLFTQLLLSAAIKHNSSIVSIGIGETLDALSGGWTRKRPPAPGKVVDELAFSFQLPSFLIGLTVGVLCTVVAVGTLTDRLNRSKPADKALSSASSMDVDELNPEQVSKTQSEPSECSGQSLHLFWPRCGWLVSMLLVQSVSTLILGSFQGLLEKHMDLAFFVTMLVGLGGNAGGQSVVLTVRRLALGQPSFVSEQVLVGLQLALILAPMAFCRAMLQQTPWRDSITIGCAAAFITVIATCLGTSLPKLLWFLGVDPAHASVAVQVLMDITGITIVCLLGYLIIEVI